MIRVGKYNDDLDSGLTHNLYHRSLNWGYEYINVVANSNNPPTIKQDSAFFVYKDETATLTTDATGNTVLVASDSVTNFDGEAIFEPADRTFTWASTDITLSSTGADGTWYLAATGAEDIGSTSIGLGAYAASTGYTVAWDNQKGGYYTTEGYRALCKFEMSSNVLSDLVVFHKPVRETVATYTSVHVIAANDRDVLVNTTGARLPDYQTVIGQTFTIKNITASAMSIFSSSIDGSTSYDINQQYDSIDALAGSTGFHIIRSHITDYTTSGASVATFESSWIPRSDWSNVHLGTTGAKDADSNVVHNLNANLSDTITKIFISSDGTEAAAQLAREGMADNVSALLGYVINGVSTIAFKIQTGSGGLVTYDDSGAKIVIDAEDWHYKVKVYKIS